MSRIPGSLEEKVNVVEMVEFALFCAVAKSWTVLPCCIEKLVLGFSVILAGKGDAGAGLLLPQAQRNKKKKIAVNVQVNGPKRNLPMHPLVASRSYPIASRSIMKWKTRSVEAGGVFSKLTPALELDDFGSRVIL